MLLPSIKAMNGNRGRMVVQAGHAFVHALWDAQDRFPEAVAGYRAQAAFKIALATDSGEVLHALYEKYRLICGATLVQESGSKMSGDINEAVIATNCIGLGPIHVDLIGDDLSSLASFK